MLELNKIYCGDNLTLIKQIDDESIDLTVTSPPYDNLRDYNGYSWDFENLAKELYRVTKKGGVVVWVVNDATINGSETGTSFKQALFFKEVGFNLNDTMIYLKTGLGLPHKEQRYRNAFEYMFVFSKGKPKTFNPIRFDATGKIGITTRRLKNGKIKKGNYNIGGGVQGNVRQYVGAHSKHPAPFPEKLVEEHTTTWSNIGGIILDPFMGSGTTAVSCKKTGRNFIGFELSQEYCDIANKRLEGVVLCD